MFLPFVCNKREQYRIDYFCPLSIVFIKQNHPKTQLFCYTFNVFL